MKWDMEIEAPLPYEMVWYRDGMTDGRLETDEATLLALAAEDG